MEVLSMTKTKELYKLYQQISRKDLDKAIDESVNRKEEQEFYLTLYNYNMAMAQQKIINQKDFTI